MLISHVLAAWLGVYSCPCSLPATLIVPASLVCFLNASQPIFATCANALLRVGTSGGSGSRSNAACHSPSPALSHVVEGGVRQAALSCGITAQEIKGMVDELEHDSSKWATSWSRLPDLSPKAWEASGLPSQS